MPTLYARRPLKNVADIAAWARRNKLTLQDGAHVTIAFSKNEIKWPKPSANPDLYVPDAIEQRDGTRSLERLGEGAIVLRFESPILRMRWQQIRNLGASWDFDSYKPHITICYDPDALIDTNAIEPWQGPLIFGEEVFEEVRVKEDIAQDSVHAACGGAGCAGCGGSGVAPTNNWPMKPGLGAMDAAFGALLLEVEAQRVPVLAFDRAPEGLDIHRQAIVVELAFDRDTSQGQSTDDFERLHAKRVPITKAGVNPYYGHEIPKWEELGLHPQRIYRLLRDPAEIKKSASTFHNLPLLDKHVPHSADEHDGDITVGTVGSEAEYEHPYLYNSLAVWSRDGRDLVDSKKQKELSSAYSYDADMTPGVYEGEPHDGVMRNMVGNHVCLVKKGRAGSDVALDEALKPPKENTKMALKSMKATVAYGALTAFLKPKLAMDSKMPNLAGALGTFEPGKFKVSTPAFIAALRKSLGKVTLAKDADLAGVVDGVQKLMASIDGDKTVEDEAVMDPDATGGDDDENLDDTSMDAGGGMEAVAAYLKSKGVPDDVIAGMPGQKKEEAMDAEETDEEKAKRLAAAGAKDAVVVETEAGAADAKPMTKGAMDAAFKRVEQNTIARINGVNAATKHVESVVGELAPGLAFDSAEGVYRHGFKMLEKDVAAIKGSGSEVALRSMWDMIPKPGTKKEPLAQDSAGGDDFAEMFPNAAKVRKAG